MTFSELMQATYRMQTVMLVLGEGESITGNAEAMDGYLKTKSPMPMLPKSTSWTV